MADVTSHQKGPEKDPIHESVVLEMNMIDNQESWMQEQRCGNYSLHRRMLGPRDEPHTQPPLAGVQWFDFGCELTLGAPSRGRVP